MKLLVSPNLQHQNLDVMRAVLESVEGDQTIEFSYALGAGCISWSKKIDRKTGVITQAIPIRWLDNPTDLEKIERRLLNFAKLVQAASPSA